MTSPYGGGVGGGGMRVMPYLAREFSGGQLSNGSSRTGTGGESPDDVRLTSMHGSPMAARGGGVGGGGGDRTLRKGPFIYRE